MYTAVSATSGFGGLPSFEGGTAQRVSRVVALGDALSKAQANTNEQASVACPLLGGGTAQRVTRVVALGDASMRIS